MFTECPAFNTDGFAYYATASSLQCLKQEETSLLQQEELSKNHTDSGFCIAKGDLRQNTVYLNMVQAAVAIWRPGPHYLPSTINTQEHVLVALLQEKYDKSQ